MSRANHTNCLNKEFFSDTYNHPVETAKSLNPSLYHDAKYWKIEQSNIFGREWFGVAHISEFSPYSIKMFDIGDQSFIITSDKGNNLSAFYNVCSHRGCKLISSTQKDAVHTLTNKRRITCPYHHWCYKLNGELLSQPNIDKTSDSLSTERSRDQYSLKPVNLDIFQGIIFLNLQPYLSNSLPNLTQSFNDLGDKLQEYDLHNMQKLRESRWNIMANWKIIMENFLEWYHLPSVHASLNTNSTMDDHILYQAPGDHKYFCYITDPVSNNGDAIDICDKLFNVRNIKYPQRMFMIALYPNIMFLVHPTHCYIQFNYPQAMDKTDQRFILLQHESFRLSTDNDQVYDSKIDEILKYWKVVNDEDVEICERVQQGISSKGYENGGWYSSNFEYLTHQFHKMIIDSLCMTETNT